ncbi:GDSL-type esterase/lipase family protein [Niveispirillum sp. KHB5.9]|uniref:GDSL-type esterase/lipase family protein n=1 Tax=Niveispirillum sp. KHB5.9 TaxID=3400269 RepID=UPI003A8AFB4E
MRATGMKTLLAAALLLGLSGCATGGAGTGKAESVWRPAWALAPLPPGDTPTYDRQTVRQTLVLDAGGQALRLRFTNELGTQPVGFGPVRVTPLDDKGQPAGPAIAVTFGGSVNAALAVGAPLLSDIVALPVRKGQGLALSIHYPGPAIVAGHRPQVEVAAGDQTGQPGALPGAEVKRSPSPLASVEVLGAPAPVLVAIGDSITEGDVTHQAPGGTYPRRLSAHLAARGGKAASTIVLNQGIAGNRLLRPNAGANMLARFERDALAQNGATDIVLLIGINDIGNGSIKPGEEVTAEQVIQGLSQLRDRAQAKGLRIHAGTLMPYEGAKYFRPGGEVLRQAVNTWIRSPDAKFDGVVDFDKSMQDPAHPTRLLPAYDIGDNLHPSEAGYEAMAMLVEKALFGR